MEKDGESGLGELDGEIQTFVGPHQGVFKTLLMEKKGFLKASKLL